MTIKKNNSECCHHFNPVDLVCGIKIIKRSDLTQFVDYSSGFIVEKLSTKVSRIGYTWFVWNAMANWLTDCVCPGRN
jgi:hypothetical protein